MYAQEHHSQLGSCFASFFINKKMTIKILKVKVQNHDGRNTIGNHHEKNASLQSSSWQKKKKTWSTDSTICLDYAWHHTFQIIKQYTVISRVEACYTSSTIFYRNKHSICANFWYWIHSSKTFFKDCCVIPIVIA